MALMGNDEETRDEFVRRAGDDRDAGAHAFSLRRAFTCAGEGIRYAFASQRNLKIHVAFAAVAVALGFGAGHIPGRMARRHLLHRDGDEPRGSQHGGRIRRRSGVSRVEPARKACEAPRARSTSPPSPRSSSPAWFTCPPSSPSWVFRSEDSPQTLQAPISRIISQICISTRRTCDGAMSIDREVSLHGS